MLQRGQLITEAIQSGAVLTNNGSLCIDTTPHTGRSPNAKKIVRDSVTDETVDWSTNNQISPKDFQELKLEAEYNLSVKSYRQIVQAGKDPKTAILVEIICERPEHALFVQNMFTPVETNRPPHLRLWSIPSLRKEPIVAMNMSSREIVIAGTKYSGEIKKSVFTYLNFVYPELGILPMHCSVNVSIDEPYDATIFFGLSGTGKTTLSADYNRRLIGDDEHGWSSEKIFNFENGCYAKTIGLTREKELEIYNASTQFGAILENVAINNFSPDFDNVEITQNGRASYPLTHIPNIVKSGIFEGDPKNIVMLTCDAFGVLPAVSKLSNTEAREQFLLGYTAKVAGTEVGIQEPKATFSPCFGAPFMPRKPSVYGDILKKKLDESDTQCWLVNTGWFGGGPGKGKRISLDLTRRIIRMINGGTLGLAPTVMHTFTGNTVPVSSEIPKEYIHPHLGWDSVNEYVKTLENLTEMMKGQRLDG